MKKNFVKLILLTILLLSPVQAALRTFTDAGDGLWSTPANWDTGVPVDGDTFAMGVGESAEFDVDQSGFAAGMGASTIAAGTSVVCSTTAGTYHMKMNGDLTLTGTLQAGTSVAVPLPSTVTFTIGFNSGSNSIVITDATGELLLYCVEPTTKYVSLTATEPIAETEMAVDGDVSADWSNGDIVAIVNLTKSGSPPANTVEEDTIASMTATTITLTGGLAAEKLQGAVIFLVSRNIRLINTTDYAIKNGETVPSHIDAEFYDCASGFQLTENASVGGALLLDTNYAANLCRTITFSGCASCLATGSGVRGIYVCYNTTLTSDGFIGGFYYGIRGSFNILMNGLIVGADTAINDTRGATVNGDIRGVEKAFNTTSNIIFTGTTSAVEDTFNVCQNMTIGNASIGGTTGAVGSDNDLINSYVMTSYNTLFGATTEFNGYNNADTAAQYIYNESSDHDQVVNAYKAWVLGGITTSQTASPPTGFSIWYEHACEYVATGSSPCFRQFTTVVQPGSAIEVEGYIRIADGEDLSADPPALQIIDTFADPLVDSTQTPLDEDEIAEPDGGVEAGWQAVDVIWANTGDSPRTVIVRMYTSVAGVAAAVDVDEVWAIASYKDDITKILSVVRPVATAVSVSDTTTSFTITAGLATADAYNNMTMQIKDEDDADDNWVERSITDWTAGRVVTVDTAFPFTPAVGDKVRITATSYGAASSGTVNANVIQISGDSTAADNLELQYDTTGLAGDTFPATQAQVGNIANTGTAANRPASSYTLTSGIQSSGTFASTEELDGVNHEHTDNGGVMDLYYEFILGSGTPDNVIVTGYLNGNNDDLEVYGYDWVSVGWKQIGILEGKAQSTNEVNSYTIFVNMVGNGADEGKVRIRFTDGAFTLTSATLAIDQIFVSFGLGVEGYDNGAIWINTNVTNTGTVVGIDGTARNPVSTMAAANTLAASTNLDHFEIAPGSSITFAAPQENQTFNGEIWTLALGSQSISGTHIIGADVTGICTGASQPRFFHCHIGATMTIPPSDLESCFLSGTITAGSAGDFFFEKCQSGVAGTGTPVFDFGSGLNASNLNFRMYSGGIHIQNMGAGTGSYDMSLEGFGQLIINANCSATSTIAIRGHFTITDNASGAVTLSDLAMFDHNTIIDDILEDTGTTIPATLVLIKYKTDLITILDTTVSDANDANSFTLTAGIDVNNALDWHVIMITDADDSHSELRHIIEWTEGRVVTVESPFGFTPAIGDVVHMMGTSYGGLFETLMQFIRRASVPTHIFDQTGIGGSPTGGGVTHFDSQGEDP